METTRRRFFTFLATLPFFSRVKAAWHTPHMLEPTPACGDDEDPTPAQIEGPYFKPNSPERSSLRESGTKGTALIITGKVLTTRGEAVGKALLDWWHADDAGDYDNKGYQLRGHQYTDAKGNFRLETIVPGLYPGRTRHLHVKVQAPGKSVLTTQLYFPEESGNRRDGIFNQALIMKTNRVADKVDAAFTFVVRV
ncbi:hypothetical protein GCM10023189_35900 [Nibrella saemangeumensis]|uniref:Intradiol ring-cleavage dioxygenases domain-containing protein n=1 Tax=Nibrella saemangeumensis TaxID=1084526 RepID=A0ABP8N547_9BACT